MKLLEKSKNRPKLVLNRSNQPREVAQVSIGGAAPTDSTVKELTYKALSSINRSFQVRSLPKLSKAQGVKNSTSPPTTQLNSRGKKSATCMDSNAGTKDKSVNLSNSQLSPLEKMIAALQFSTVELSISELSFVLREVYTRSIEGVKSFLELKAQKGEKKAMV